MYRPLPGIVVPNQIWINIPEPERFPVNDVIDIRKINEPGITGYKAVFRLDVEGQETSIMALKALMGCPGDIYQIHQSGSAGRVASRWYFVTMLGSEITAQHVRDFKERAEAMLSKAIRFMDYLDEADGTSAQVSP